MSKKCNICGEENQDVSKYCHMCGFKFGENALEEEIAIEQMMERRSAYRSPFKQKRRIKKKTLLLIVVGIIVLFFLGNALMDKIPTGQGRSNSKDLEKIINIMGMQENQKREDTRFFDPNLDFKYSDNPLFNNQKEAPKNNGYF